MNETRTRPERDQNETRTRPAWRTNRKKVTGAGSARLGTKGKPWVAVGFAPGAAEGSLRDDRRTRLQRCPQRQQYLQPASKQRHSGANGRRLELRPAIARNTTYDSAATETAAAAVTAGAAATAGWAIYIGRLWRRLVTTGYLETVNPVRRLDRNIGSASASLPAG